jgi:hypothetical protein
MFLLATALILLGGVTAVLGLKLFRVLLPIVGLVAGVMVGFGGVQGVFGTGVISLSIAIVMAIIVGVVMAVLSFMFFEIAVYIVSAIIGAAALSYLGIALGLNDNGVLVFLLSLAGAVIGFLLASSGPFSTSLVVTITSFAGVSLIFAGVMLLVGEVSVDDLNDNGIINTVLGVVDDAFLWFIAWFGAGLVASRLQIKTLMIDAFGDTYAFQESAKKK